MISRNAVILVLAIVGASPAVTRADTHSTSECLEGGDFIRNAALSRDAGFERGPFMDKVLGDLMAIRAVPVDLRWFARDEADESLLTRHVRQVFDQPAEPQSHQAGFVEECMRPQ